MVRTARSIPDYDTLFDPVRQRRQAVSGRQLGDPARAAAVMLDIATSARTPPTHLLLGSDALGLVRGRLAQMQEQLDLWAGLPASTDASAAPG